MNNTVIELDPVSRGLFIAVVLGLMALLCHTIMIFIDAVKSVNKENKHKEDIYKDLERRKK